MPDRAADYQAQLTGNPPGYIYDVKGVKFDGFEDGVLLEVKGPGYAKSSNTGSSRTGSEEPRTWWTKPEGRSKRLTACPSGGSLRKKTPQRRFESSSWMLT
jgi:hypothetical protein